MVENVSPKIKPSSRRRPPLLPMVIVGVFIIFALFGPWFAPHPANEQHLGARLSPPVWDGDGSSDYLLGTDKLGRDILSRIIVGSRAVLIVVIASVTLGGVLGGVLGLLAGYYRGKVDTAISIFTDGNLAIPPILLALLLAITMGPGFNTVILAIGLVMWSQFTRVTRGETISARERDWVIQARIDGCSDARIMGLHIVPHVLNSWIVMATLQIGVVIILEASLSFLGGGIPPPTPAWGKMVADGRDVVSSAWWVSVIPGLAIMAIVLSFNMLGDWLREVLDPKLRQV